MRVYGFQDQPCIDWGEGLPLDVLALLAGGRNELKAMRGVNKIWQEGFERSIKVLRIGNTSPPLPADDTFCQRFPGLVSLHLGRSPVDEVDLTQLEGFKHLRILNLGGYRRWDEDSEEDALFVWLTGAELQHLSGLQLEQLGLSHCQKLADQVCHAASLLDVDWHHATPAIASQCSGQHLEAVQGFPDFSSWVFLNQVR